MWLQLATSVTGVESLNPLSLYLCQESLLPITCLSNMVGTLAFSQESQQPASKDAGSSSLSGATVGLAPLATQWRSAGAGTDWSLCRPAPHHPAVSHTPHTWLESGSVSYTPFHHTWLVSWFHIERLLYCPELVLSGNLFSSPCPPPLFLRDPGQRQLPPG